MILLLHYINLYKFKAINIIMEKNKGLIDVYGVILEGLISGRLKSEDAVNGLCWLTDQSRIEMGIFEEDISPFVKSIDKVKSFLSVNNPNNLEKTEITEGEYDRRLIESVAFKKNGDLANLINKNPRKVHVEATSYKSQRSYPMIVLQMFMTIREYIHKNYPQFLTTKGDRWVQFAP